MVSMDKLVLFFLQLDFGDKFDTNEVSGEIVVGCTL